MSSHREAPEISKDPVADNTDVYAFRSPDKPDTVTLIANFIPLQQPDGGPNFYEFGDDVAYDINISNGGKGKADIVYRFRFTTKIRNAKTFLYNTGPINDISDKTWNRPQYYSVTRLEAGRTRQMARGLACPPVNVGKRSTPNYAKLAAQAVHSMGNRSVFAGQRADAFHVDLGSIFDLGALRPFNQAHLIKLPEMNGVNSVQSYNVHTIALQVPISDLSLKGDIPKDASKASAVIGVWASASRQQSRIYDKKRGRYAYHGPWQQVSRLGNPLFNEVIVPMAEKDKWNASSRPATRPTRSTSTSPSCRGCCPRCTPRSSRSSRPTRRRVRTSTRSCSPASPRASSPASRTTPGRSSRTCCGSTSPYHRPRSRTTVVSSPVTQPASPTGAGSPTTW